ncbi:hypothetical protein JIP62_06370 [Brevundimonas vitis]|uniref:Uncharacterized protein n=1 Tax=Brevundimonas vitisensis TaxID=2800818 RepID=A0ABX7BUC9_9CAUL|nr:hypothetical protein [Brevundimonas vitisensis]QQQ19709.1 hypothetical protein JIP62_06370 [Brevundimonas vitisensis]
MARRVIPAVPIAAQLIAVRRAASSAAVVAHEAKAISRSHRAKATAHRDALAQAAATLMAVRDSAEALSMLPQAQRDKLATALVAGGYRAVLIEQPASMEAVHD